MTALSAARDRQHATDGETADAELAALLAVLEQVRQVRADQREALTWLAEHPVRDGQT
jgi:hypothetical protein